MAHDSMRLNRAAGIIARPDNESRDNCDIKPVGHVILPDIEYPAHWVDQKHELDGTARNFIETGESKLRSVGELFTGENVGAKMLVEEMNSIAERHAGYAECWDDVTGAPMVEALLRAARNLEMDFFTRMGVWAEKLPKELARARGGKVVQGRWVDTDKGDTSKPDYRARFVAKESNTGVDTALFAATPPLEALKLLLAYAASDSSVHIMLSDVKRAYFNAFAQRDVYV